MVWVQFLALQIRKEPRLKVHQGRKNMRRACLKSWKSVLQLSSDFNTSALGSAKHYLYGWDYLVYYWSHSLHPQFQLLGTGLRGRAFSILKTLQSLRAAVQSPQQLRLSLLCVPPDPQFNDTLSEAAAMVPNSNLHFQESSQTH